MTFDCSATAPGNLIEAAIHAALLDFGVTRLMSHLIAAHLAAYRLKRVLAGYEPLPLPRLS